MINSTGFTRAHEIEVLSRLLDDLKETPIVTLAGVGGAYQYMESRIAELKARR